MKTILFLLGLLFFNQAHSKQKFYKWADENGVIHYTQEKPLNQKTKEINIAINKSKPTPKIDGAELNTETQTEKTIDQRFDERRKKKQKAKITSKQNLKACKKAKSNLAKFKQAVRYRRQDSKTGEYQYLEDSQRTELLKEFKSTIKKTCK